jgi:predicted phosphodiesterase
MWVGALASPSPSVLYTTSAPPSVPTLCAHAEVPPRKAGTLRIVCLADTHESHARLRVPHGDVLIIAGDMLTLNGRLSLGYSAAKLRRLASWIQAQPHRDKIVIAGNHDSAVERLGAEWMRATFERDGVVYLEDSGTTVAGGLTVWGSPYSRNNHPDRIALFQSPNVAFQSDPERRLGLARRGADILITHGPLLPEDLARLAPRLYVCGHVHELHGVQRSGPTLCVNAATMDKAYQPTHAPVVVDFALGPRGPAVVKAAAGGSGWRRAQLPCYIHRGQTSVGHVYDFAPYHISAVVALSLSVTKAGTFKKLQRALDWVMSASRVRYPPSVPPPGPLEESSS